jgi:alpha/beta superfamily hydrolase
MKGLISTAFGLVASLSFCLGPLAFAQNLPSNMPSAIFSDPPRDPANPMRNEAVWIPTGGVLMNGVMYAASGAEPHPTVLNLHGTPGNEQNLDLAQALRRAGYNVLSFHYRGSWGSPGQFTQAGGVDDGLAALAFLQNPVVVAKFHIDTKRLIVIGHSYGGFVAVRVAAARPSLAAVVLIAPWNPAQDIPIFTVAPANFAAAAHSIFDDDEGRMGGYTDVDMAREILAPGYDWHLESSTNTIKKTPLLIVTAKHDSPDVEATELIAALNRVHASDLTTISMDTDHPFSDHRITLETTILNWLEARRNRPVVPN